MNILVVGGGGREHALVWAIKQNSRVETVWCAPGNAGISQLARCVSLDLKDSEKVLSFLQEKKIDLTVIGPEDPLVDGLADVVRESGHRVFGPGRAAARLEGSKVFAKNFMKIHGIPTADFKSFSFSEEALSFVDSDECPENFRIVKANGLAAGKGVAICVNRQEVKKAIVSIMVDKTFGSAGDQLILEEVLEGEELSVIALCDGQAVLPLISTQDHKRIFDDDKGPNTGGMGAYGPVPQVSSTLWQRIQEEICEPFLRGIKEENMDYCGVIYIGLMLTPKGPKVLEFNVRFGDPETQVILPMIENDWLELFHTSVDRKLNQVTIRQRKGSGVCVVLASKGYPGKYEKGKEINGLASYKGKEDILIFHGGTSFNEKKDVIQTSGGRVLGVVGLGPNFELAREKAYEAVSGIRFEGVQYRKDIGMKALRAQQISSS